MTTNNQFYPTPRDLAARMWKHFDATILRRSSCFFLEPSAGRGNLFSGSFVPNNIRPKDVDVVEIDFDNQAILRSKEFNVVGHDFLQFEGAKSYSHIIMNSPFLYAAQHTIHAFNLLKSGELVSLLNAQTIRNPSDKYHKQLAKIIEDNNGITEFTSGSFTSPDTMRKTKVECAIVYIKKEYQHTDISFIDSLKVEIEPKFTTPKQTSTHSQLAIKQDVVKQAVSVFKAAVKSMEKEVTISASLQSESLYFSNLLGDSITKQLDIESINATEVSKHNPISEYNRRYAKLKEQAWSYILGATKIGKHLSSKVQNSIRKDFANVSSLEFNESNIYGFLTGLMNGRSEMNSKMLADFFDSVTLHSTSNRAYYQGWKSNDKHKKNAYRIKMTRFIKPLNSFYNSLTRGSLEFLNEVDLCFALLDARSIDDFKGVKDSFENEESFNRLSNGERLTTEYFDIRYYPGVGTIHFFPRNKKCIDRLNKLVGRQRQWLPPVDAEVSNSFWAQYGAAERITEIVNSNSDALKIRPYELNRGDRAEEISNLITNAGKRLKFPMDNLLAFQPETHQKKKRPNQKKKPTTTSATALDILSLKEKYSLSNYN